MKFNTSKFHGYTIKENEVYTVIDNKVLEQFTVSQTILHPGQCTTGHSHAGQEEVYMFEYGIGEMLVGDEMFTVRGGDIVLIKDGLFHRVTNLGESDLIFNCVFNGVRNH